jgi:peptidoglycan-N-acetylglucosamine deacetylase
MSKRFVLLLAVTPVCALGLLAGLSAGASNTVAQWDRADAAGPLDVARAVLGQRSRVMTFTLRSRREWSVAALDRTPNTASDDARFACLRLRRFGHPQTTQLCLGDPGVRRDSRLGLQKLSQSGEVLDSRLIRARVARVDRKTVEASFHPDAAGLAPHSYHWRVSTQWSHAPCPQQTPQPKRGRGVARTEQPLSCHDFVPDVRPGSFRLLHVRKVGCVDSGPHLVFNGPRNRRAVALTFDDGPSSYTRSVISILDQRNASGTFFQIGDNIPGREGTSRAVVRSGNELANHTLHHEQFAGRESMDETSDRIQAATGFRPCLFRPTGGGQNSRVVSDAKSLGMTTVIWDVDPTDWQRPGSDAIYSRVVSHTQPGSIVLLHDGGGDRSQTVAALPRIISTLRARGYRLVTVSRLLGQRMIWRPVG